MHLLNSYYFQTVISPGYLSERNRTQSNTIELNAWIMFDIVIEVVIVNFITSS